MMNHKLEQFVTRLKFVKVSDLLQVFPMAIGFALSIPFRRLHPNIWLVCERKSEARDNGYVFFRYLRRYHPEIEAVYAIDTKAKDYNKVKKYGKVIDFSSLAHWIYYFSAKRNISSQKEGKPNPALCFLLEVYLGRIKNRAYIHHGITKDDQRWIYYDVTKMNLITCTVQREYEYVMSRFGYPEENVKLVGLCRFDRLLKKHPVKKQILVMPTHRQWLFRQSSDTVKYEGSMDFKESEYYKRWNQFINNEDLLSMLKAYDYELIFYMHAEMQQFLWDFCSPDERIKIAASDCYDVQQLLMESSAMITDYSSVYFDFAYMKKPLAYYQFDYERYRAGQYQTGYFDYDKDGFGDRFVEASGLIEWVQKTLDQGCVMEEQYKNRAEAFFTFMDNKNCERLYEAIVAMK